MSKEETVTEKLDRIIEVDMQRILETIMKDEKLSAEDKGGLASLANIVLHHLRLMRVRLE